MLDFEALKTPSGDGDLLVEPVGNAIPKAIEFNRKNARSQHLDLAGCDIQHVRRQLRDKLNIPTDAVCIVTGHQPEFVHAGVWAKYVVADELARRFDTTPIHLVVDNDAIKHTALTVPVFDETKIESRAIPFTSASTHWPYENVPALTAPQADAFAAAVTDACAGLQDHAMPDYLSGFRNAVAPADFVDQMAAGAQAVNAAFGVNCADHRVSRIFGGPLVAHLIADAANFATAYNNAIAAYRREHRIRQPNRPIPDLTIAGNRIELPLWTYGPGEVRHRVFIECSSDARTLLAEHVHIGTIPLADLRDASKAEKALAQLDKPLRPRALTLTLWARLLLADVFIHGIGGAKYDRITDRLIADYFGLTPPIMMCVTATLRLQTDLAHPSPSAYRAAVSQIRQIQYSPHKFVPNASPELLQQRRSLVDRSNTLRAENPSDHAARRATYLAIRDANRQILAHAPQLETEARTRASHLVQQLAQRRLADSREYFVALHTKSKLFRLAEKLRSAVRTESPQQQ